MEQHTLFASNKSLQMAALKRKTNTNSEEKKSKERAMVSNFFVTTQLQNNLVTVKKQILGACCTK
jgi:hypothetical protein